MKQTTNSILMIRPVAFRMNEQTAVNNYYQKVLDNLSPETVNAKAQAEFDAFVTKLTAVGVGPLFTADPRTTALNLEVSFLIFIDSIQHVLTLGKYKKAPRLREALFISISK